MLNLYEEGLKYASSGLFRIYCMVLAEKEACRTSSKQKISLTKYRGPEKKALRAPEGAAVLISLLEEAHG